ncbi:tryptophan-rich antigen [Plasmodium gonderi]|uniref:Tryptophan-rich antigen n=1 Tax=Plasmodium gonderi TaxID=77519 RepID=A0A1Y1JEJ3_PLAGO|nr:tryptophan-rich antigen [Plasmodium gonderi]GAW80088.1 tryptophan-rich antigen [Plasmodium gonderi]
MKILNQFSLEFLLKKQKAVFYIFTYLLMNYLFKLLLKINNAITVKTKYKSNNTIERFTNSAINYSTEGIDRSEQWDNDEWYEWMNGIQKDLADFNSSLESEKNKWFGKKEKEILKMTKSIEDKWLYFNKNMYEQLNFNTLNISLTLDISKWEEWINNDGKRIMENEWHNWITKNKTHYYKLIIKEWLRWKNMKIKQWLKRIWFRNEGNILENWEHITCTNILAISEKKTWFNSNPQVINEKDYFFKWIKKNEDHLVSTQKYAFEEWEYYKTNYFHDWINFFIANWLNIKKSDAQYDSMASSN